MNNNYHTPVLLHESIENLITDKNGIYVDVTFGGGGHSQQILKKINNNAKLIAMDDDIDALYNNKIQDKRLHLFHMNFVDITKNTLIINNINNISGIIADLGVSSHQFNCLGRGFSINKNDILDMRMNQNSKNKTTALGVINVYTYKKLIKLFSSYGEIKKSKQITQQIIKQRLYKKITTTKDLISIIKHKNIRKILPRIFQAIRIEVNNEIENLKIFLQKSSNIIKKGGRLSVISYHSLEDRIVKNFFKNGIININNKLWYCKKFLQIHKKVITPNIKEIISNRRSRSAKLRIAEKI